jgi:hypothetical protein
MEIRSYRRVFDLERRIYRIDSLRLNPAGVPVRGIVYFFVALLAMLALSGVPGPGIPLRALPWYLRDVALPGLAAVVLAVVRIAGRPFHLAARSLLRYHAAPRRLSGSRGARCLPELWRPDDVVFLPDGSDAGVRGLRYKGPGALRVSDRYPGEARARVSWRGAGSLRRAHVVTLARPAAGDTGRRPHVVVLERGARLSLLPERVKGD